MCSQFNHQHTIFSSSVRADPTTVIALPISIVARVKVSPKQKFGLLAVMSLGVFIVGVAIARVIVTDTQGVHPEISWLALWSVVESSVAVLVCCLASFKVMTKVQHDRPKSRTAKPSASMPSGDCKLLMALPCLPSRCWCQMGYVFILITILWSSNAARNPCPGPFSPQSSILSRQDPSTLLIIKGCHYCYVPSNVRTSSRQRRTRTANTSIA